MAPLSVQSKFRCRSAACPSPVELPSLARSVHANVIACGVSTHPAQPGNACSRGYPVVQSNTESEASVAERFTCPNCGTPSPTGAQFCATCGQGLDTHAVPASPGFDPTVTQPSANMPDRGSPSWEASGIPHQPTWQAPAPYGARTDAEPSYAAPLSAEGSSIRSSRVRGYVAMALVALVAIADLVAAYLLLGVFSLIDRAEAGTVLNSELVEFEGQVGLIAPMLVGLVIAAGIAWAAWLSRAAENAAMVPARAGDPDVPTPRWTIAWCFIPIANFLKMPQVVRAINRRFTGSDSGIVTGWWIAWAGAGVLNLAASAFLGASDLDSLRIGYVVSIVGYAALVIAAVLAILTVRAVTDSEAWAAEASARGDGPEGAPAELSMPAFGAVGGTAAGSPAPYTAGTYDQYGATSAERTPGGPSPLLIAGVAAGAILIGLLVAWFFLVGRDDGDRGIGGGTQPVTATASSSPSEVPTESPTEEDTPSPAPTPTDEPPPTATPTVDSNAFPNAAEETLIAMIPDAIQANGCTREEDPSDQEPLAETNVQCGPGNPYANVWYHAFASADAMNQAFDENVAAVRITGGGCIDGTRGTEPYKVTDPNTQEELNTGQVLCYATSDPSRSVVVWTDDNALVLGYTYRLDGSISSILDPWNSGDLDLIMP